MMDLLKMHGFKLSKSMGQNFLIDANIPEKIVRLAGIDNTCGVLEVGPGLGALTSVLGRVARHVTSVELDERLMPILRDTFSGQSNVDFVCGNILKLDIAKLVNDKMPNMSHHVCANLPYYITSPVLSAFIDSGVFATITVMIQKEVARRICAQAGTSDYSAFSIYVQYYAEPKILFDVPPECFVPQPGVFSSVITMRTRTDRMLEASDEKVFFRLVRAAFGQRRKTLVNTLHAMGGGLVEKAAIVEIVQKSGFDERVRGEMLSLNDFARLTIAWKRQKAGVEVDKSWKML